MATNMNINTVTFKPSAAAFMGLGDGSAPVTIEFQMHKVKTKGGKENADSGRVQLDAGYFKIYGGKGVTATTGEDI